MRTLAAALVLLLVLAGCRSSYWARPDDFAAATSGAAEVIPAHDEDGEPVSLRVSSIVSNATDDGGRLLRAADGRPARTAGWILLAAGVAGGLILAAHCNMGSDVPMGPMLGVQITIPFVAIATPFLAYGYAVGSPEE